MHLHLIVFCSMLMLLISCCLMARRQRTKAFISDCDEYQRSFDIHPPRYTVTVIKHKIDELEREYKGCVYRKAYKKKMSEMYSMLRLSRQRYRESILN